MEKSAAQTYPDFAVVFAALPGASAVFAADAPCFTVLAASDALLAVSQRPRALVVGRPLAEAFPDASPNDPEASGLTDLRASLAAAVETGVPQHMDRQRYDLLLPDGTWEARYWDAVNIPLRGPDGTVRQVLHQTADVTAQVHSEAAAARAVNAERRAEGILERMGDAHCVLDRDYTIVSVNAAAERLLGRSRETLLGRSHWEMFPASFDSPVGLAFRRVVNEGIEQHLTHHYAGEGYDLHLEVDVYPTEEGGLAMFWRDVTDRIRAEAALRRAAASDAYRLALTDALRTAADPMEAQAVATRMLGEHLGAGRVSFGEAHPESAETFSNRREYRRDPAMPASLGRHRWDDFGEHVAAGMRAGRTLVVDDLAAHPARTAGGLAAYEAAGIRACLVVPIVRDGRAMACLSVDHPVPHAWTADEIALAQETAERTWAAVTRVRAEEALRESDRRKDEFLATLAHELRNPLAPISNALQFMRYAGGKRRADRLLPMVERQVRHMVRLVDDLMDISRISRGKVRLRRAPVTLAEILNSALETTLPAFEQKHQQLTVGAVDESIGLVADKVRLIQVFANLLNNAAKYTPAGGQVWITACREGQEVSVTVRDTGMGIGKEQLPLIFEMFSQPHGRAGHTDSGLGIGLAMVRSLVELHGGEVHAHSAGGGKGSQFVVRLPLAKVSEALFSARDEAAADSPARLAGQRILVVDDNRDAADSLSELLAAHGADAEAVYDGRSAIEAAHAKLPHAIVLDIGMPDMDGHEVARRIRQDERTSGVVLVALSGWGQDADRQRSRTSGFDHHLTKPTELETLLGILFGS